MCPDICICSVICMCSDTCMHGCSSMSPNKVVRGTVIMSCIFICKSIRIPMHKKWRTYVHARVFIHIFAYVRVYVCTCKGGWLTTSHFWHFTYSCSVCMHRSTVARSYWIYSLCFLFIAPWSCTNEMVLQLFTFFSCAGCCAPHLHDHVLHAWAKQPGDPHLYFAGILAAEFVPLRMTCIFLFSMFTLSRRLWRRGNTEWQAWLSWIGCAGSNAPEAVVGSSPRLKVQPLHG